MFRRLGFDFPVGVTAPENSGPGRGVVAEAVSGSRRRGLKMHSGLLHHRRSR